MNFLRRSCPGIEEHKREAARLAADLRLDRRAVGDECGVAATRTIGRPAAAQMSPLAFRDHCP